MPGNDRRTGKGGAIPLVRVAGIQITIDFSWFVIFGLIFWSLSAGYFPRAFPGQSVQAYWFAGFMGALLFFLSVVVHELSHSLMALRSGIIIPEITLFIFGGVSKLSEDARDPETEFKIAVVGPLSSLVLAGIFRVLEALFQGAGLPLMTAVFGYLSWINIVLAVFNLIPGFPLDGGRILRAFLWWKSGSMARSTKVASDFGKGFAIVLMLLGAYQVFSGMLIGGMWMVFIGVFLRGVAEGGYQEVVMRQALEGVQAREVMVENVVTVSPDIPISHLISGYFLHYGYKGFPVEKEGNIVGIVSLGDIRDVPEEEQRSRTVGQVMTPIDSHMIITPEVSLAEALKIMSQRDMGRLLVMQNGRMIGMITKTGLLRLLEIKQILKR